MNFAHEGRKDDKRLMRLRRSFEARLYRVISCREYFDEDAMRAMAAAARRYAERVHAGIRAKHRHALVPFDRQ